MIVEQMADVTLVCPRARSADFNSLVALVEGSDGKLLESHCTVNRPWGSYTVLEEAPGHKIKKIFVKPGGSLSKQYHRV